MQKILAGLLLFNLIIVVNISHRRQETLAISKRLVELCEEKLPRDKEILRLLRLWESRTKEQNK